MITIARRPALVNSTTQTIEVETEYRPTVGPDFIPTADDEAYAVDLLNGDDREMTDEEWDQFQSEREETAFADPHDLLFDGELIECRGYHLSMPYDV